MPHCCPLALRDYREVNEIRIDCFFFFHAHPQSQEPGSNLEVSSSDTVRSLACRSTLPSQQRQHRNHAVSHSIPFVSGSHVGSWGPVTTLAGPQTPVARTPSFFLRMHMRGGIWTHHRQARCPRENGACACMLDRTAGTGVQGPPGMRRGRQSNCGAHREAGRRTNRPAGSITSIDARGQRARIRAGGPPLGLNLQRVIKPHVG